MEVEYDHEKIKQAISELSRTCGLASAEITRGFNAIMQPLCDIGSETTRALYRSFWVAMHPKKKRRGKKWKGYQP